MIPVKNGATDTQKWQSEKRHIKDDIQRFFGKKISKVQGIAIMSDSDNTQQSINGFYRNIYFSQH